MTTDITILLQARDELRSRYEPFIADFGYNLSNSITMRDDLYMIEMNIINEREDYFPRSMILQIQDILPSSYKLSVDGTQYTIPVINRFSGPVELHQY